MPEKPPGTSTRRTVFVIHTLAGTSFVPEERGLAVMLPPPRPTRPHYVTTSLTSDVWDEVRSDDQAETILGYVTTPDAGLGEYQVFQACVILGDRSLPAPYGFARQDLAAKWVADYHAQHIGER